MSHHRLTRALIALAVPALTVSALTTPATAATKGPAVPTVEQVAKVYPHLAGGTAYAASSKVLGLGRNCKPGKPIKGASATTASYTSADPADYAATAARPMVYASAMRFRSAQDAIAYLHASTKGAGKCPVTDPATGEHVKVSIKKIRFKLGDERWGYTVTASMADVTTVSHSLLVRAGKVVVSTGAMSMDGAAPDVARAVKLTAVALRTAR